MPMVEYGNALLKEQTSEPETVDTWHWWNKFRSYSDYNSRFVLALELTADLPAADVILRWLGEMVEVLIIPTHLFIQNRNNYPVLPYAHKNVVLKFLARTNCKIALKAPGEINHGDGNYHDELNNYVNFLRYLYQENYNRNEQMVG